jgi:2-haloacid dehalogenase
MSRGVPTKGEAMLEREALAFDVYGTLVDPLGIEAELRRLLPGEAAEISRSWRQKQLEYTFRLTAMERYEDFERVTRKALEYTLAAAGRELESREKDSLMTRYDDLERFPDAVPGLERLREAGHATAVFSNGSPRMLDALMEATGLGGYFQAVISVDEVRAYKPSPQVYRHAARRLGREIGEVRLVSSNPFDVVGAEAAGMRAAWIDRSGGLFDTLGPPPDVVVSTLTELADALR